MDNKIGERLKKEEYEVQFFGFSHTMLSNLARNEINGIINGSMSAIKTNLQKKNENEPDALFDEIVSRLTNLYFDASKTPLTELENIIQECMKIPDYVLLTEDEIYQRNQHTGINIEEIDKEIEKLTLQASKAKYMERKLKAELIHSKAIVDSGMKKIAELQKKSLEFKHNDKWKKGFISELENLDSSTFDEDLKSP